MNTKIKIYIIILGFLAFWMGGIPFLFSKAVPIICENISFNSAYKIELTKPQLWLNIIPVGYVKAKEVKIYADNSSDSVYIENPSIKIRLLPLLLGKIHINELSVKEIILNATLKEKLVLNKDFIQNVQTTKVCCDSVKIDKFDVKLNSIDSKENAQYSGNHIYYKKNSRYIKVNIDSNIDISGKKSDIKAKLFLPKNNDIKKSVVDVDVKNLDIAPIKEYLKHYLPSDLADLNGIININVDKNHLIATLYNTSIIMKDSVKSIIFPKNFTVKSDFNLTGKTLNILNSEFNGGNINVNINGAVSNYIDKSMPAMNLTVRLNKSKVEDIINILPPLKTEDIDIYKLKKYKFYGDAIGNFNIKGDLKEPGINGNVFVNNGVLTKPIPNTGGATIKLSFLGKYLNYDVQVPTSGTERVWVKGGVELYNVKYADMRVWSTKNVDLATAEEKLNPLHEILNFVIGPVPIMDIKGKGNIDITIKGNRQNPHIWGVFKAIGATVNFNEMPNLILSNANATLTFDDENAVFILDKGDVNSKPANLQGTCNLGGKFDFDVLLQNQNLKYLYNAVKTSTMIDDVAKLIPDLTIVEGLSDLKMKIYGNVKNIEDLKFNENCFYSGKLELKNNVIGERGIKVKNINGNILFDKLNIDSEISAQIGSSPINAVFNLKNTAGKLHLSIPRLNLADIIKSDEKFEKDMANIFADIDLKYNGDINNIDYNKIDLVSNILKSDKNNKLQVSEGKITLKDGKLNLKNIKGHFINSDSSFDVNINTDKFMQENVYNGSVNLKNFDLSLLNIFGEYSIIPSNIRDLIKNIKFTKGKINLNSTIKNNNINASTNLGGIEFIYTPLSLPIKIINGSLYAKRNYLGLNKINLLADNMPVLIDGGINDIFKKQEFDLYFNSKPKQDFIDKYVNINRIYPMKIKGDIVYWAKIKGIKDNCNFKSEALIAPDSSFYYLGAFVGDVENAIVLNLDANMFKQNNLKIKEFSYDKIISSLSGKKTRLNMLKAKGGINLINNNITFQDLKIKTSNPTDARIFNIIFRKPNIKQGQFTSDLKINGNVTNPKVIGNFHIFETNVPFLDTTMKNISLIFDDRNINIKSFGEIMGNDIKFKGTLRNKLSRPYYIENAELYTKVIDLNYLTDKIKSSQVDEYQGFSSMENIHFSDIFIKNIKMTANGIKLRNLIAENVEAILSLNEKQLLDINQFKFDIANGSLNGNFKYNITNGNTYLNLKAKEINANDITYAVFDLNNQIYGDLTGDIKLSCQGTSFNKCMETLNGKTTFNVSDGKMPKLGSMEYLLKAGNLIKGGVTGVSINGIIDIITPLKTGDFSDIIGKIEINNGIADNIEISTKGKDLNLFISGSYNFANSNADMEVLGLLSKKISTMFGPIGNVSLNTLFNVIPGVDLTKDSKILDNINKIPGLELSQQAYRKFIAEIKGNIDGDNYVKSFRWIN